MEITRSIKQMQTAIAPNGVPMLIVLCDDGSLWIRYISSKSSWNHMDGPPPREIEGHPQRIKPRS